MQLKVRNIDFNYDGNGDITTVNLRFDCQESPVLFFNGSTQITIDEYNTNATNLPALAQLAMDKLKAKING